MGSIPAERTNIKNFSGSDKLGAAFDFVAVTSGEVIADKFYLR